MTSQRLGGTRVAFLHARTPTPLANHTAEFVHVLVLLAAGFALCFGESINLTW